MVENHDKTRLRNAKIKLFLLLSFQKYRKAKSTDTLHYHAVNLKRDKPR